LKLQGQGTPANHVEGKSTPSEQASKQPVPYAREQENEGCSKDANDVMALVICLLFRGA